MFDKKLKPEYQQKHDLNEKNDWILCVAFCATLLFLVGSYVYDVAKYKQELKKIEQLKQDKTKQLKTTLSYMQYVK